MSESNSCSGLIDLSSMRGEEDLVLGLVVGLVGDAAAAIGLAIADPAHQVLGVVVVLLGPVVGQAVEQLRIGDRIVVAEIVHIVLGEALAEEMAPGAIDERLGEIGTGGDQLGQFLAAICAALERILRPSRKVGSVGRINVLRRS